MPRNCCRRACKLDLSLGCQPHHHTDTNLFPKFLSPQNRRGMFSSSVRRVGFIAPQVPIASFANSAPRAAVSQALSYRSHQRRLSSSKPSNPADGSNGVAAGQNVPAAPSQRLKEKVKIGAEKKAGADKKAGVEKNEDEETKAQRKYKRKAKSAPTSGTPNPSEEPVQTLPRNKAIQNLPSVPSTHHIAPSRKYLNCHLKNQRI